MTGLLDYYLGPTGAPDKIRALGKMLDYLNPVTAMGQSMQASQRLFAPETDGWGRVQATGDMLSGVAGVVAPAAIASRAGMSASNALQEGLMGFAPATRAAGQFVASEAGSVGRLSPAEARAQNVLDYLTSGRASEVTDEMLEGADPQYLYRNYDLPMDYDSRMGRAQDMGFDTDVPLYHGTGADFEAFDPVKIGSREPGWYGEGIYSTAAPDLASEYTTSARFDVGQQGNVIPVNVRRGQEYVWGGNPIATSRSESREFRANLGNLGYDTVRVPNDYGSDLMTPQEAANFEVVTFDPRNIRSRFARFDPRLAHLRNLSAGIGALGIMGTYGHQQDEREALRAYLDGI